MMHHTQWILLDTETTGLSAPIFVVELAAQRMLGWSPDGPPFRRILNQNTDIPPEVSRIHGYTREILERDGESPIDVYRDFRDYVDGLPLVAYNNAYDLDDVLFPEWDRLGIARIGSVGFCALGLAQRLLDPVPAGNCKLQTLRQYYRLPERGAHTALGDVETVADLMATVLRPLAEARQLDSWEAICNYVSSTWYPSRIAFGKHKGRLYQEAKADFDLYGWLEWLAQSSNPRSASMGRWYLAQLDSVVNVAVTDVIASALSDAEGDVQYSLSATHITIWRNPELEEVKRLVVAAQAQLAELESEYTREHHAVAVTQGRLFNLLKDDYLRRDHLRLAVEFRRKYLDALLRDGEESAEAVLSHYRSARRQTDKDYEQTANEMAGRMALSDEEEMELKTLYRKLVRLYHPDRFLNDPAKAETFHRLTAEINRARDAGDIATLREIATDPHGFMLRHGMGMLDFNEADGLATRRKLFDSLQARILEMIEALDNLRADPAYELHQLTNANPDHLRVVAEEWSCQLAGEIATLGAEAAKLDEQIIELAGELPFDSI